MNARRRAALEAMASQDVSAHERDIARAKLEAQGAWPPPPRPPAPPAAAPSPDPGPIYHQGTGTTNVAGGWFTGTVYIRVVIFR